MSVASASTSAVKSTTVSPPKPLEGVFRPPRTSDSSPSSDLTLRTILEMLQEISAMIKVIGGKL